MSFAERFEIARAQFAPSPMTIPRSAAFVSAAASSPGATRISSSSSGGAPSTSSRYRRLGSNEPSTTPRASSSATADAPPSRTAARGEIQIARDFASRPQSRRSADAPIRTTVSRSSFSASPAPTVDETARRQLAGRDDRGPVALARDLLERREGPELAADPPVDLAEGSVERRLADDRDREDVGLDVPGLVGDNTQLHAGDLLRSGSAPRAAPSGQWSAVYVGGRDAVSGAGARGRVRSGSARRSPTVAARPSGVEQPDRRVELAPRLLDRDHRLVEPAPADLGEDDHECLRVRWEPLGRLGLGRRTRRGPRP